MPEKEVTPLKGVEVPTEEEKISSIDEYVAEAATIGQPSLNYLSLKKSFPKTMQLVIDYAKSKLNGVPLDENTLIGIFMYNPERLLTDFFDDRKVFFNTIFFKEDSWDYSAKNLEGLLLETAPKKLFPNRATAISIGFTELFRCTEGGTNGF